MRTLLHLGILTLTVLVASRLISGVKVKNAPAAVVIAIVFSVVNWVIGLPIKMLLFLPAVLTFGILFLVVPLIVNAVVLWITDKLLHVFELENARALWLMAALITAANAVFRVLT